MKGFGIYIKNDLLDPKHLKAMHGDKDSGSLWLYLWILDKMTVVNSEKGEGKVLGGKPVRFEHVKNELGISRRTYARWLGILRDGGYITTIRTPYGLSITVHKAQKIFNNRPKTDVPHKAHLPVDNPSRPGTSDVRNLAHHPSRPGTSNKTIQYDNTKTIQTDVQKKRLILLRRNMDELLKSKYI